MSREWEEKGRRERDRGMGVGRKGGRQTDMTNEGKNGKKIRREFLKIPVAPKQVCKGC